MFRNMSVNLKRLFGKRLATLRESKNLKQHQLGRRIGKRDKYISDIETGRIYPRPDIIVALSEALALPISTFYLFEGVEDDPETLRKSIEGLVAVSSANQLRKFLRHMLVSLEA
jgi:transcriptional regulator with XRE-family HTH domain